MTDDDIKRLREAAQAATPGPWRASALDTDLHDRSEWTYVRGAGKNKCVYAGASVTSDAASVALCPFDYADSPQGMRSPNAAYIAAASPAAILPLLDRLEAVERERDAMAALLTEARGAVAYANYHGSSGAPDALLARIDALAAKEQSK
jgi:hypothetical protein